MKLENLFKGRNPEERRINMAKLVKEWREAWLR